MNLIEDYVPDQLAEWDGEQKVWPVPVSVRHPTRLDCDEDGRCWWFYQPVADQHDGCWQFESNALYRYPRYWPTHWLPANTPFPIP